MSVKPPVGLREWIWRAFLKSALIPLILVETVLIAVYLLTNSAIRDTQIGYLRDAAIAELQASAVAEARIIELQLEQIAALTDTYRQLTTQALLGPTPPRAPELALTDSGVRYTPRDTGGGAVFYANSTPPERQDLDKVARLATLDPLMQQLVERNPLVASVYFNSWDSLNHIYPWFLTPDQYPHDMVIPNFNFYYLADARHNPQRKLVWTDVYLDPAGQGWMMSAIAPVYRGDFLEGVSGIDVTVGNLLDQISELRVPWDGYAMLVSDELNIMALPAPGEADFRLDELTEHSYDEAVRQELFKPEDFNLAKRPETRALAAAIRQQAEGVLSVQFNDEPHLIAWTTIPATGWHLLTVVPEENVFSQTNALAERYLRIGYLLIAGLVLFYLVFFVLMWTRARRLSEQLRAPIAGISGMMDRIGRGDWQPEPIGSDIRELEAMARHTADMGQRLQHSEAQRSAVAERLELVVESATESLWERDLTTGQVSLRGRFIERFGLPSGVLDDATFRTRVHPDDLPRIDAATIRVHAGQETYETEFRYADAEGRYHWLLSRGRVMERDPDSRAPLLLAGTHIDIDAIKQTEADLRQANLEALAASKAKSRFISSISHELRTPLNAIHGFAQLMRMERGESLPGNPDYIDEILIASAHLNQLVGDILEWSSIQAEKPNLELQAVPVQPLLRECAELVALEVQVQGLTLNLDLPEEPLQVRADPRRLRQVMLNLLSNAIKYNTPAGQITLTYQVAAGHIRLMVEDTGLGVDPQLQQQLFEPFQRLGRENTAIQGTGIGLSLCREFAQLMGGQMGLHSEPGIGSTFWIELPLAEGSAPQLAEPGSRPQVFYVEDNPASQFLVRKALADLAEVSICGNGRVALERILANPPALLLLDLNLPGLSGEALLHQLRAHPATAALKVVVLSAASDNYHPDTLDCQGVLAKPIDLGELRRLVDRLLHED